MAESDVKLLGAWASPYVHRVQIALNLKSIKYEFLQETFHPKSDLLLKSNPVHKKIPVLIHGDNPICESLVIVEYIDEVWTSTPSLLPSDPYDRAMARFWSAYVGDKWFPLLREIRTAEGEEAKSAAVERLMEGLVFLEKAFVECSKGKDFFGGDCIGILDIAFGSFLGWIKAGEKLAEMKLLDETKAPGVVRWAERFLLHDAVKDVIPPTVKLVEYAKMRNSKAQSSN